MPNDHIVDAREEHEASLISAFVTPSKRERFLLMLQSTKGRQKLRDQLPHFDEWDERFIVNIPPHEQTPDKIAKMLLALGSSPLVHVISSARELDDKRMLLDHALASIVGVAPGTIVSCLPGQLAYFEGESRGDRHIMRRGGSRWNVVTI